MKLLGWMLNWLIPLLGRILKRKSGERPTQ